MTVVGRVRDGAGQYAYTARPSVKQALAENLHDPRRSLAQCVV